MLCESQAKPSTADAKEESSLSIEKRIYKVIGQHFPGANGVAVAENTPMAALGVDEDVFAQFISYIADVYGASFAPEKCNPAAFATAGQLAAYVHSRVDAMRQEVYLQPNALKLDIENLPPPSFHGSQADIYYVDGKAIKLFYPWQAETKAYREAQKQMVAYHAGIRVPAVFDVVNKERTAIVMEYIDGQSLGDLALQQPEKTEYCNDVMIDVQLQMHGINGLNLPKQKRLYSTKINEAGIDDPALLAQYLAMVNEMEEGNALCHGDLHLFNLVQVNGDICVIDWQDASLGSAMVDVCRSYLLYALHDKAMAERYLAQYCQRTQHSKEAVLRWLPLNAAVRLGDTTEKDQRQELMEYINAT